MPFDPEARPLEERDCRPCPFWSWNDELEPEELRRQVRAMHDAGLGGFFMHARSGLKTEYLSDRWMECVNACLDEAGKLGMKGWLYDENGWPSGFGGGIVNGMGVKYQQKYLVWERLTAESAADKARQDETIALYDAVTFRRLREAPASGEVLRFFYEVNPYYVDNMDGAVVAEFIRSTHEFYCRNIPPELLKHLRGIFTDEPQLSRRGTPWSFVLEEEYRRSYGEELSELLPMLFFNLPGAAAVRFRFWKLVSRLFAVNFMKQIADWCTAHGWELTGHNVLEETYGGQVTSGGAVMPHYEYYHIPGMDVLTRNEPDVLAMDQLVSVAAQTGHRQVLTESFALTGWGFNFRGMRWLYGIQMAHGVNFLCQHLEGYSLKGRRKRDYPGSWFIHQPWWDDYKYLNDRFTRVGRYLAEGAVPSEILVLHGISTAWTLYNGGNEFKYADLNDYTASLRILCSELHLRHARLHIGDESIMERTARVEEGRLVIGKCGYRTVVLPQIGNMFRSTFRLLSEFAAAGGRIIGVRNHRDSARMMIDGVPVGAEEKKFFAEKIVWCVDEPSAAAAAAADCPALRVTDASGIVCRQLISAERRFEDFDGLGAGRWYFIMNLSADSSCEVDIAFPGAVEVREIDADTGRAAAAGAGTVRASFAPADSRMYFVPDRPGAERTVLPASAAPVPVVGLDTAWRLAAPAENILTLDNVRWQVDGGEWVCDHVSVLQNSLLRLKRSCDVALEYRFTAAEGFSGAPDLIVEEPGNFSMELNGVPFANADHGYLFDKSFRRVALPASRIRAGSNVIRMKTRFRQDDAVYECLEKAKKFESEYNKLSLDSELEAVYLAGNFRVDSDGAVEDHLARDPWGGSGSGIGWGYDVDALRMYGDFRISRTSEAIDIGCINTDGYPFFAGAMTVRREFELSPEECGRITRFSFRCRGFNSVQVVINGVDCGRVFWEPWQAAVPAGALRPGRNVIELRLVQSLRNMLGPHHLQSGESGCVSTISWEKGENIVGWANEPFQPAYCFAVCGVDEMVFEGRGQ